MKRDMDLVRKILMRIEESETPSLPEFDIIGDDFNLSAQISFHVELMLRDEILEQHSGTGGFWPTNKGYDLLDMIRDEDVWHQTKKAAVESGRFGGDVLVALAKGFIKQQVEKHTGVEIDL